MQGKTLYVIIVGAQGRCKERTASWRWSLMSWFRLRPETPAAAAALSIKPATDQSVMLASDAVSGSRTSTTYMTGCSAFVIRVRTDET